MQLIVFIVKIIQKTHMSLSKSSYMVGANPTSPGRMAVGVPIIGRTAVGVPIRGAKGITDVTDAVRV